LKRSLDTAADVRRFQLHLVEAGLSIGNRNRIMTGVKFPFRVTLRRHDLAAEIYHLKEPQKLPLTMSPDEAERLKAISEWRHTAHEQPAEARITYRYHPRFGEVVQIRRRLESGGFEFVVVLQPDGSFASLPAWMTEPAASRFEIVDEPHFPLHILRLMRAEVDALLGFLLSESKTETADNGGQIRKSPTKPARRGDAAREAVPCSQGRARGPRGSSAPRDRSDAGQRKKRGEHP